MSGGRAHPRMPVVAAALALLAACARGPALDPAGHVTGEHARVLPASRAALWPALVRELDDEGIALARMDRGRGTISTRPQHYDAHDTRRRLGQIADVERAHAAGLGRVSEISVTYHLLLLPADPGRTRLLVRSEIEAIDGGAATLLGPGLFQIVPRKVSVPSRGVVERELMRRLMGGLFAADEMLLILGEPGVD